MHFVIFDEILFTTEALIDHEFTFYYECFLIILGY